MGTALGVALERADHVVVACSAISHASRQRAQQRLPDTAVAPVYEVARRAELLMLAVPDAELQSLVAGLAATAAVRPGTIVAHTSGANGIAVLAPLTEQGCIPLAIHPAMTFTGSDEDIARLPDACFGITAADETGYAIAQSLVLEIGGEPFRVSEDARTLYHAALAHASNHVVTVVLDAVEALRAALLGAGPAGPGTGRRRARRHRRAGDRAARAGIAGERAAARAGGADRSGRPWRRRRGRRSSAGADRSRIPNWRRRIGPTRCAPPSAHTHPRTSSRCWREAGQLVTMSKPPQFAAGELNVYTGPRDVSDVTRALRHTGRRIMLVPTMGALHEGHVALIRAARGEVGPGGHVTVTIFVNPLQFAAGEDLNRYPRDLRCDLQVCAQEDVDLVFARPVPRCCTRKGTREDQDRIDPGPRGRSSTARCGPGGTSPAY